ncbi:hypothetical protein KSP40_PGU006345 [Platanthera guangdongensis]|uniref:JmjC domain-containing protein n=1 Tax=Platanthera guangdongensis TaxID=2320717 RepID=A0ABR2M3J3_9ASPA
MRCSKEEKEWKTCHRRSRGIWYRTMDICSRIGKAVLIPAGCPHQLRNFISCTEVALDFDSPENVKECMRLTEDFRVLPKNHRAKEDKLELIV